MILALGRRLSMRVLRQTYLSIYPLLPSGLQRSRSSLPALSHRFHSHLPPPSPSTNPRSFSREHPNPSKGYMDTLDSKIEQLSSLQSKCSNLEQEINTAINLQPKRTDLLFFYGDGCQFTKKALPHVSCLERFLKAPITRHETWHNEDNHALWKESGGESNCGGVPFFYNSTSGASVCGAADCSRLKEWSKATTAANKVV